MTPADYNKVAATSILVITYLAALAIAIDIYVRDGPTATLPPVLSFVLGTGVGVALHIVGVQYGTAIVSTVATIRSERDASS